MPVARYAGLAAESSATPLKFFAESVDFDLHPRRSFKQLADLMPVLVAKVSIFKAQLVDCSQRDLQVDTVILGHVFLPVHHYDEY